MFDVHGMASVTVTAVVLFVAGCQKTSGIELLPKEVEELSMTESSLTCSQLSPNCTVYWSITGVGGQVKQVGSCTGEGNCSTPFHPTVYPVRLNSSQSSMLTFKNVTREWAGTVTCTERFSNGTKQSVNTTVDVYYNSGDYNSRLVTHRENWTISVIFNMTRIFSALGNYAARYTGYCDFGRSREPPQFTWVPDNNQTSSGQQDHAGYFLLKTSFPGDPYCLQGRVIISPGERPGSLPREELEKIQFPSTPSASCGATYIPEVGPVNCSCSSGSLGRPEGRLRWLLGERVVAFGGDGVRVVSLPADVLNRSHDGKLVTCQLEWAYNLTNWLTIRMAYGPDNVIIMLYRVVSPKNNNNEVLLTAYPVSDGNVYIPPDERFLVTLGCGARNVQPWNSDMIRWGGLCQGQQGFTCNLTSRGIMDDGKKVTCAVINHANNRQTSSASVMLKVSEEQKKVSIQYHTSISANGKCQVNLSCQAPDVRPSTYEMFEWNGLCDGQKGPTCVVADFLKEDDGIWFTCTVTNHINRRHRASVRLTFSDCVALLETTTDDGFKKGVGTGIGATLTLVLLGFCLVLAVLWRRGLLCEVVTLVLRGRIYDQPQPRSQDAEHIYEMTAAKGDNPDRVTEHQQQDDATDLDRAGDLYENLQSDQQPDDATHLSPPGDMYENVQSSSKTQSATVKQQRRK